MSFHERGRKPKIVSCISESQDKYITISHSYITSCQSWSYQCGTTVKQQMCTRKNTSSKYQQVLVHHSSARILCTVPCMVLLIHVQGGCSQTGGGAEWRWENENTSSERGLIAWLKQGQYLIPEYIKTQHWSVLLFQSALHLPAEVLHPWPPSLFACFKCCSLIVFSEFMWEGGGADIQMSINRCWKWAWIVSPNQTLGNVWNNHDETRHFIGVLHTLAASYPKPVPNSTLA